MRLSCIPYTIKVFYANFLTPGALVFMLCRLVFGLQITLLSGRKFLLMIRHFEYSHMMVKIFFFLYFCLHQIFET